jgi:flagellar protein FlbD
VVDRLTATIMESLQFVQHAQLLKRRGRVADARPVIQLHRLHGNGAFYVNPDLIETIEARPDTTITLVNKHRYVVEDRLEDVVERIVQFRARIAAAVGSSEDVGVAARALVAFDDQDQEQAA